VAQLDAASDRLRQPKGKVAGLLLLGSSGFSTALGEGAEAAAILGCRASTARSGSHSDGSIPFLFLL